MHRTRFRSIVGLGFLGCAAALSLMVVDGCSSDEATASGATPDASIANDTGTPSTNEPGHQTEDAATVTDAGAGANADGGADAASGEVLDAATDATVDAATDPSSLVGQVACGASKPAASGGSCIAVGEDAGTVTLTGQPFDVQCNVVADACGAGSQCNYYSAAVGSDEEIAGYACVSVGRATCGQPCSPTGFYLSTDADWCAPGTVCVSDVVGTGVCAVMCCSSADCGPGEFCVQTSGSATDLPSVGVCAKTASAGADWMLP